MAIDVDALVAELTLQEKCRVLSRVDEWLIPGCHRLGIPPPEASWGNMLNAARSTVVLEQYVWQWMFPGAALVLAVLAINFIGDGLRDAFDPRSDLN